MITDTLSALSVPSKDVLEPAHKLNQQAIAAVEKLVAYQIDSLKAYSELGVSRLKAAVEVRDVEGLKNLLSNQTDVLKEFGEHLMTDYKAIFKMGADFVSKSTKVGTETAKAA